MVDKRKIKQGESLLELAYESGFGSWKTVWNDEANAELRELRKDPQVLLPGDEIAVPKREVAPKESCPVDKVHRFRLVRPRVWVNLRMRDEDGEPLAAAHFRLTVEGTVHEGTTDADGLLSVEVSPNAHEGHLTLWPGETKPPFEATVRVGHLDPASVWSGARARMMNLGMDLTEQDDNNPAATCLSHARGLFAAVATKSATATELATALEEKHDK